MVGKKTWVIAEGYIPSEGLEGDALKSHETACILNANDTDAHIKITIYYQDKEEQEFEVMVPASRTKHLRFNSLDIPLDTDYSAVFESDIPIVVQHTRLDSRNPNIALLSTMAYSE